MEARRGCSAFRGFRRLQFQRGEVGLPPSPQGNSLVLKKITENKANMRENQSLLVCLVCWDLFPVAEDSLTGGFH